MGWKNDKRESRENALFTFVPPLGHEYTNLAGRIPVCLKRGMRARSYVGRLEHAKSFVGKFRVAFEQVGNVHAIFVLEKIRAFFRMPVADDLPVLDDDGVERPVPVICAGTEIFFNRVVAAFVAKQVFVIRRQQQGFLAAAFCPAILVDVICLSTILFLVQFMG